MPGPHHRRGARGGAPQLHANRPGNILVAAVSRGATRTAFARRHACRRRIRNRLRRARLYRARGRLGAARGDRIEVTASTQAPYWTVTTPRPSSGLPPESVRIIPSACGGGFGSKLDLSVQPYVALAAWLTGRPAAMVYTRPESIQSTTKRHPAHHALAHGGHAGRRLARHGFRRRLQHRRLFVLGADGGEPRAGARLGPLSRAELPRAAPAPSSPTACRPAPSAASACRRRWWRRSRCSTCWRRSSGSMRSNSAFAMP